MKHTNKLTVLATCLTISLVSACTSTNSLNEDLQNRQAKGDITTYAGARRTSDNQISLYKEAFNLATKQNAKNVILLIGDGMGDSEITAARNYAHGAGGYFKGIDALPFTGQYTHYSLLKDSQKPDYVTDSAASATAWSTGVKTYNGAIGVDVFEKDHQSLLELAQQKGLSVGNVSTAEIEDATPAAQIAHVVQRKCYGPDVTSKKCPVNALENGGKGSIVEQIVNRRADVVIGGGALAFNETIKAGPNKGKRVIDVAKEQGYQLVNDLNSLNSVTEANGDKPVLGLFSDGNMPIRLIGPQASYHGNLEKDPVVCKINDKRGANVPTLAQMTQKAIDLLSVNEKGFFLQVEGASIDKQAHASNPCGQFGETMDLDEAVQVALNFAKDRDDTLVIVTADHAHSTQIVYPDAKAPGFSQAVMTQDGVPMSITYGNSEDIDDTGHTGAQLRLAAFGPSAIRVTGLTDQTDLFFLIKDALDL